MIFITLLLTESITSLPFLIIYASSVNYFLLLGSLSFSYCYLGAFCVSRASLEKDSDAGRDGAQEEKGTTEDEMAGWHH